MNTVGKCIITGIFSALAGAGVSYFVTKRVVEAREYEKCIALQDQAISEVEAYYKSKIDGCVPNTAQNSSENDKNGTNIEKNEPKKAENDEKSDEIWHSDTKTDTPLYENVQVERTDYHSILKTHYDLPEGFDEQNDLAYLENKRPNKETPYLISYNGAYLGDNPELEKDYYGKVEITYYLNDYIKNEDGSTTPFPIVYNVDEDRVMTEYEVLTKLGYEWRNNFGAHEEFGQGIEDPKDYDTNEVCVRNDKEQLDFHIEQVHAFYKVDILGMDEDENYDYPEAIE